MTIGAIFGQIGKDLLKTAFPAVYNASTRYRKVLATKRTGSKSEKDEAPVTAAVIELSTDVKASNEITTDTLEAILVQNDLLTKILKQGLGGNGKSSITDKVTDGLITGAEVAGGLAIGSKLLRGAGRVASKIAIPLAGGAITHYLDLDSSKPGGSTIGDLMDRYIPGAAWLDEKAYDWSGGLTGVKDARKIYGWSNDKPEANGNLTSTEASILSYTADEILFKAKDLLINTKDLIGLGQDMNQSGGTVGTATKTGAGSMPVFRPGIGGNAGQRSAREPYIPRDGASNSVPGADSKNVPPAVLENAKRLLQDGGSSGDLQRFMAAQGYPKSGNWCGEFTAAVVKSVGGTPPKGAAIASNWMNYGQHVEPKDVRPGDIAVRIRSRYTGAPIVPGATGSHVGLVYSRDEKGNFQLEAGNQGRAVTGNQSMSGYEFRRAIEKTETPAAANTTVPTAPKQEETPAIKQAKPKPESKPDITSGKFNFDAIPKAVRKQYGFLAKAYSDDDIKTRAYEELKKAHPNLNVKPDGTVSGTQAEITAAVESTQVALKDKGLVVAGQLYTPADSVKVPPKPPVKVADPSAAHYKQQRDKAQRELKKLKQARKTTDDKALDSTNKLVSLPPSDRSDKVLFQINPQLHKENYPQ